jgi:hypothetical protein
VVTAQLVDGEPERHHGEGHDRPPAAHGERSALQDNGDDGQRVERAVRHAAEPRALAVERGHERPGEEHRPDQGIPERVPAPELRDPPKSDHRAKLIGGRSAVDERLTVPRGHRFECVCQ